MHCFVAGCRYPSSHTTLGHKCGKCGNFGHGVLECGRADLVMNLLVKYKDNILKPELQCKHHGCKFKQFHTTKSHKCEKCGDYHDFDNCIIDNSMVINIIQSNRQLVNCIPDNKYSYFYAGMGCKVYIKNFQNKISGLFMHSDSWGQYGPTTDDTPKLDKFLKYNQEIDKIKCPICRNDNNKFELTKLIDNTNLELQCSICLQNLNTKYVKLNNCNHTISCIDCFRTYLKS